MNRLPVEDDLRNAIAVDPPRSFAAGVRARIAAEPESRVNGRLGVSVCMAAVTAFTTIAVILALRPSSAPVASIRQQPLIARSTVSTPPLPAAAASSVRQLVALRSVRTRETGAPAILISSSESHAILAFIEGPRTWQIDPSSPPAPSPVADLVIDPIVIAPLSVGSSQGVRQ